VYWFSIIIPTFNSAQILPRALESILSQKYKDYEVLVMDGASSDGTREVVETFRSRGLNCEFFSEKDNGIYDAMNKGIAKAKGKYLYFLGSDDRLFDDQVLQNIYKATSLENYKIVYGQVYMSASRTLYFGEFDPEKLIQYNISHQAIFTHRDVFQKHGVFDLAYKICADHIFNIKWFFDSSLSKKFVNVTIAEFAQTGISTLQDDLQKIKDLPKVVLKHAGLPTYLKYYFFKSKRPAVQRKLDVLINIYKVILRKLSISR
jgi:glycosyltransferase involved in cell wall biosynthesis